MKWNILALDIASITGWCTHVGHGAWNLNAKKDESKGMRLIRLHAKIDEVIKSLGINLVCFEMAAGQHKQAISVESELIGVMKLYCELNKIEYRSYTASAIKKHATGKGNANKEAMIMAAREKWGYMGTSSDEVDAMWIYDLAMTEYGEL